MVKRKSPGYWEKKENRIQEAKGIVKENKLDRLTYTNLASLGRYDLANAITRNEGYTEFNRILGLEESGLGRWKDETYMVQQAELIKRELKSDQLPSAGKLVELGYHKFVSAVIRHSSFSRIYELLGENPKRTKCNLNSKKAILEYSKKIINENDGVLPSATILKSNYGSTFIKKVNQYFKGGLPELRAKLKLTLLKTPNGLWPDLDYVLKQAELAIEKENWETFPGEYTLRNKGYNRLADAIKIYHGPPSKFRSLLEEHLEGKSEKDKLEELLDDYIEPTTPG